MFVDYEMMDYNFPGYDIGKLLLETLYERDPLLPSYSLKSWNHFPSDDDIQDFIHHYLFHRLMKQTIITESSFSSTTTTTTTTSSLSSHEYSFSRFQQLFPSIHIMEKEIQHLFNEIKLGVMISGFYTMILGMSVGKNLDLGMDFIQFVHDGYKVYMEFKSRVINHQIPNLFSSIESNEIN